MRFWVFLSLSVSPFHTVPPLSDQVRDGGEGEKGRVQLIFPHAAIPRVASERGSVKNKYLPISTGFAIIVVI